MESEPRKLKPAMKNIVDLAPVAGFMTAWFLTKNMMIATALLMALTFISLGIFYAVERKIALMPLITGVMVGVFGGLTLFLQDETFIKMKPTIINVIFATILLVGWKLDKPLLKYLFESAFKLDNAGWYGLSLRWGLFFLFLALVNEVVWRNFSTDFWISFKLFGMLTLNILFWIVHVPYLQKHMQEAS
ncbi:MAG: septation protein A [Alphaproteobacteria bacterium]|nr:septation protein A [Alphaproteobacteria bacterium]